MPGGSCLLAVFVLFLEPPAPSLRFFIKKVCSIRYLQFQFSCLFQLLERNVSLRLGYCWGTKPHIRKQPFFSPIDWNKLEKREIKPPFRPEVVSLTDSFVKILVKFLSFHIILALILT